VEQKTLNYCVGWRSQDRCTE